MAKPLKVLFLLEDLCYGGTQKQNLALALRLDRERFEPQLLILTGPTDLDLEARDLPITYLGEKRRVAPFFFLRLPFILNQLKPDILMLCTALPNIWGRLWGKALQIPVIVGSCRGGGAPVRQHEWALWRLANGMVCNSQVLQKQLYSVGMPEARVRYIANGVDTRHFTVHDRSRGNGLIVSVCRLVRDKDLRTLLAAFGQVAGEFPEIRLRLVGEGSEEKKLRAYCQTHLEPAINARIEFAGAAADPAPHYAEADIFALSSVREGQPNAILEAMSSGLPVCATNVGGIPNLVKDNGLLSPPGDIHALAANLRRMLMDGALRTQMGARGRERIEKDFSFAAMTAAHENFFQYLWDNKK